MLILIIYKLSLQLYETLLPGTLRRLRRRIEFGRLEKVHTTTMYLLKLDDKTSFRNSKVERAGDYTTVAIMPQLYKSQS